MMRILLLSIFCFWSSTLFTQEKEDFHYTWIALNDGTSLSKGYLMDIKDDYVAYLSLSAYTANQNGGNHSFLEIPIENIDYFAFREHGQISKYVLRGGLIGMVSGGLLMQGAGGGRFSFSFWDKLKVGALLGGVSGMIIGGLTGSMKQKIYIKGNKKTYERQREKILRSKIF